MVQKPSKIITVIRVDNNIDNLYTHSFRLQRV